MPSCYNPNVVHCAPYLHVTPCCSIHRMRHMEYFHDHVRIAKMLFEGVQEPRDGALMPNTTNPGIGLELKRSDAEKFRVQRKPAGSSLGFLTLRAATSESCRRQTLSQSACAQLRYPITEITKLCGPRGVLPTHV